MKKSDKLSIPQLKKIIEENFTPSSLTVTTFFELRNLYNCHYITDPEFVGIINSLHFELFGNSGAWMKKKIILPKN